jgi:hypothetical protein
LEISDRKQGNYPQTVISRALMHRVCFFAQNLQFLLNHNFLTKNGFVFKYMLVSACVVVVVVVVVQVGYQISIFVAKGHYTLCTVWEIVLVSFFIFIFQLCIKIFY